MPRQTDEHRAALDLHARPPLGESPHLSPAEKKAWRVLVAACPAGHLTERDRPLVETWVCLQVATRKLSGLVATADAESLADSTSLAAKAMHEIAANGRTLAGISNRLKIAPLATHSNPDTAAQRKAPPQGERPVRGLVRVG